jgi:hypothetical protein
MFIHFIPVLVYINREEYYIVLLTPPLRFISLLTIRYENV